MEDNFLPDLTPNLISSFQLLGNLCNAAQYFVLILETSSSGWGRRTLRCHKAGSTKDQQFRWNLGRQSMPIPTDFLFFLFLFVCGPLSLFVCISLVNSVNHTETNRNPLLTVTPKGACWHTLLGSLSPHNGFRDHTRSNRWKAYLCFCPSVQLKPHQTPSSRNQTIKQLK